MTSILLYASKSAEHISWKFPEAAQSKIIQTETNGCILLSVIYQSDTQWVVKGLMSLSTVCECVSTTEWCWLIKQSNSPAEDIDQILPISSQGV